MSDHNSGNKFSELTFIEKYLFPGKAGNPIHYKVNTVFQLKNFEKCKVIEFIQKYKK